jgi:Na+/phosphate symporter
MRIWIKWKYLRTLVSILNRTKDLNKMNDIQKLIFEITLKLINNPNSELRSNSIDFTYQVENDDYLIVISEYSVNLIEYRNRQVVNNFDVSFDIDTIKKIVSNYEREIHKRMKSKLMIRRNRVTKHLENILNQIDSNK